MEAEGKKYPYFLGRTKLKNFSTEGDGWGVAHGRRVAVVFGQVWWGGGGVKCHVFLDEDRGGGTVR